MNLRLCERGTAIIEFALSLPILVLLIWGIFECSLLFEAKMNAKLFGPNDGTFTVSDPVDATDSKTLTVSYTRTMNFLFFTGPTVTLTRSKLVYTPTAT
jgi:hypothetical protein